MSSNYYFNQQLIDYYQTHNEKLWCCKQKILLGKKWFIDIMYLVNVMMDFLLDIENLTRVNIDSDIEAKDDLMMLMI